MLAQGAPLPALTTQAAKALAAIVIAPDVQRLVQALAPTLQALATPQGRGHSVHLCPHVLQLREGGVRVVRGSVDAVAGCLADTLSTVGHTQLVLAANARCARLLLAGRPDTQRLDVLVVDPGEDSLPSHVQARIVAELEATVLAETRRQLGTRGARPRPSQVSVRVWDPMFGGGPGHVARAGWEATLKALRVSPRTLVGLETRATTLHAATPLFLARLTPTSRAAAQAATEWPLGAGVWWTLWYAACVLQWPARPVHTLLGDVVAALRGGHPDPPVQPTRDHRLLFQFIVHFAFQVLGVQDVQVARAGPDVQETLVTVNGVHVVTARGALPAVPAHYRAALTADWDRAQADDALPEWASAIHQAAPAPARQRALDRDHAALLAAFPYVCRRRLCDGRTPSSSASDGVGERVVFYLASRSVRAQALLDALWPFLAYVRDTRRVALSRAQMTLRVMGVPGDPLLWRGASTNTTVRIETVMEESSEAAVGAVASAALAALRKGQLYVLPVNLLYYNKADKQVGHRVVLVMYPPGPTAAPAVSALIINPNSHAGHVHVGVQRLTMLCKEALLPPVADELDAAVGDVQTWLPEDYPGPQHVATEALRSRQADLDTKYPGAAALGGAMVKVDFDSRLAQFVGELVTTQVVRDADGKLVLRELATGLKWPTGTCQWWGVWVMYSILLRPSVSVSDAYHECVRAVTGPAGPGDRPVFDWGLTLAKFIVRFSMQVLSAQDVLWEPDKGTISVNGVQVATGVPETLAGEVPTDLDLP
jgi:hypothetical protein